MSEKKIELAEDVVTIQRAEYDGFVETNTELELLLQMRSMSSNCFELEEYLKVLMAKHGYKVDGGKDA